VPTHATKEQLQKCGKGHSTQVKTTKIVEGAKRMLRACIKAGALLGLAGALCAAATANGGVSGAIFTTDSGCNEVSGRTRPYAMTDLKLFFDNPADVDDVARFN